jgi:hypothetical protein
VPVSAICGYLRSDTDTTYRHNSGSQRWLARWYSQREYHQEWGWLSVIVLAGVVRAVVHTNCGYLRLCMPRCMHKLGGQL